MKSVLISIQPYYVFLIIARIMGWNIPQNKTVEVRKDFPKDSLWNKITHIYCSKNRKSFNRIPTQYQPLMEKLLGKVIGEFICDKIDTYRYHKGLTRFGGDLGLPIDTYDNYLIFEGDYTAMCLTYDKLKGYGKDKTLYGWHISDLKIYDKPKELREFWVYNEELHKRFERGKNYCCYDGTNEYGELIDECCLINENVERCYRCWEEWSGWCHRVIRAPQSWCYVETKVLRKGDSEK